MRLFKCLSVPMTWRFIALLLPLSFFAQGVSAVDYYWSTGGPPGPMPTPSEVCEAIVSSSASLKPRGSYISHSLAFVSVTKYHCNYSWYTFTTGTQVSNQYSVINRFGTTCPPGTNLDVSTGICTNPCTAKKDQLVTFKKTYTKEEFAAYTSPGDKGSSDSCELEYQTYQCGAAADGTGACWGVGKFTGDTATAGKPSFSNCVPGPTCTEPTVKFESSNDGSCTAKTVSGGVSHYTCVSTDQMSQPGAMSCGMANGQVICSAAKPIPVSEKNTVNTTVDEVTNPDTSKTTTTKTDTTKTSCKGANGAGCVTSTSNNTNTTNINADGTKGPESSNCTGSGCSAAEELPEEEEPEPSVSGDGVCAGTPACSGDAIQCAILRQTHKQRCADEEFRKVDAGQLKTDVDSAFSAAEFQPLQAGAAGTFNLEGMIDTGSRFSKTCPVVPDIAVPWLDNTTVNIPVGDLFTQLCQYLIWLGYFVVAFAMRRAAEIIAMGMN